MPEIQNIVVPVDFNTHTEKLAEFATFFAEKLSAKLHFIHVCTPFYTYGEFVYDSLEKVQLGAIAFAEQKMVNLVEDYAGSVGKVETGDVVDDILAYTNEVNADLVIIGTHGAKGLEKILLGSIAERVLKKSPCPTLVFNPYK